MAQSTFRQSIANPQLFMDSTVLHGDDSRAPHLQSQLCQMAQARYQIRQLLWKLVFATFLLMTIGSATRVMNAGLACPDWPLCYGTLIPTQQMNLQVFLEWIHRLDASLIGLMTIGLVGLSFWQRRNVPQWLPWASVLALVLVCVQGGLGALTVTALLRFDIVTAHLGTALCFFALLLAMAIALIPSPGIPSKVSINNSRAAQISSPTSTVELSKGFVGLSGVTALMIYGQSLTGGLVGSQWALHQCLTISHLCSVMNSHLLGVIPSTLGLLWLLIWAWRQRLSIDALVYRFIQMAGVLLLIQIGLGIATFRLHLEVEFLTIAHQTTGAALFGVLLCSTVRGWLLRATSPSFLKMQKT